MPLTWPAQSGHCYLTPAPHPVGTPSTPRFSSDTTLLPHSVVANLIALNSQVTHSIIFLTTYE